MRPTHIVIEGLRSFRQRVEIDFGDRQLFAIVGDTGAGKSSILEAITFALYGGSTWDARQNRSLLSDTADDMLVELAFESAGKQYRLRRTASRRPSRPSTAELHCITDTTTIDNVGPVGDEVRRILGLDRDAFLKTVILPQGRFAELLTATPAERDNVLKNIFRVDELEQVRRHASGLRERLLAPVAALQAQRAQLPEDPQTALDAARAAEQQARADSERLAAVLADAEGRQQAATEAEQRAAAARRAIEPLERDAASKLTQGLDVIRTAEQEIVAARTEPQAALDRATAELQAQEQARTEAIAGGLDTQALAQADATLRGIADALPEVVRDLEAIAEGRTVLAAAQDGVAPLRLAAAAAQTLAEQAEAATTGARTAREQAAAALEGARLDLAAARSAAQALAGARDQVTVRETALATAREQRGAWAGTVMEAQTEADRLRADLEALERANAAAHAAVGVHAGDACPICQRALPDGFAPPAAPVLDAARAASDAAERELATALQDLARAEGAVEQAEREIEGAQAALEQVEGALAAALETLRARLGDPRIDLDRGDDALLAPLSATLEAAQRDEATRQREQQAAADARHRADQALREAEQQAQRAQELLDARIESLRRRAAQLERDAGSLPPSVSVPLPLAPQPEETAASALLPTPVAERREEIRARLETLRALEQRIEEARRARDAAAERLRDLDERMQQEVVLRLGRGRTFAATHIERLRHAGTALDVAPGSIALDDEAGIDDLVAVAGCIEEQTQALVARAESLAEEQERAATAARDALALLLAREQADDLAALRTQANTVAVEAGIAATRGQQAEADVKTARDLDERLGGSAQLLGDLETLRAQLQNGTFIGELLAMRSRALVAAAAHRLMDMTGGRYAFAEDFEILDQLTGQPRSARTLSGGESFLASLALALGMVDLAARSGGRLDALFLDEGFGALDAGNAGMAIDALESAAAAGRMVGVISHVSAVAERIDDVLVVVPHPEGSRVAWRDGADRAALDDATMSAALKSLLT